MKKVVVKILVSIRKNHTSVVGEVGAVVFNSSGRTPWYCRTKHLHKKQ